MKKLWFTAMAALFWALMVVPVSAQTDDVYYDPDQDDDFYWSANDNEVYDEPYEYHEIYDDYYYTRRLNRFARPSFGFGYFSPVFVDQYFYDPFFIQPGLALTINIGSPFARYSYGNFYSSWNRWYDRYNWNYWNPWSPYRFYSNNFYSINNFYGFGGYSGGFFGGGYGLNAYCSPYQINNYYGGSGISRLNNDRGTYYGSRRYATTYNAPADRNRSYNPRSIGNSGNGNTVNRNPNTYDGPRTINPSSRVNNPSGRSTNGRTYNTNPSVSPRSNSIPVDRSNRTYTNPSSRGSSNNNSGYTPRTNNNSSPRSINNDAPRVNNYTPRSSSNHNYSPSNNSSPRSYNSPSSSPRSYSSPSSSPRSAIPSAPRTSGAGSPRGRN